MSKIVSTIASDNFEPEWFHDEEHCSGSITDTTSENTAERKVPEDRYSIFIDF